MRFIGMACLVFLLASCGAEAVPTPTPDPTIGKIEGSIIDGNAPVANVEVGLLEGDLDNANQNIADTLSGALQRMQSDSNGTFVFENVKAGQYLVAAMVTVGGSQDCALFSLAQVQGSDVVTIDFNVPSLGLVSNGVGLLSNGNIYRCINPG